MLSYPNRQKFEQIRSQWEAVQAVNDQPSTMVGRRERSVAESPRPIDPSSGPGRFRRKLSHGFSLISNPLSQRKVTPIRQTSGPSGGPTVALDALLQRESKRLPTAARTSPSSGSPRQRTTPSDDNNSTAKSLDPDVTTKPLPRSRTMSFLPRPSRSDSLASLVESESMDKTHTLNAKVDQDERTTPTKIPTPSPPKNERRHSSPRQYVDTLATQRMKHVATGSVSSSPHTESPSKGSVRSYTTPNLMKPARSSPRPNLMPPRTVAVRKSGTGIPVPQKSTMKENANPTGYRHSKRLSQIQEDPPKHEIVAASTQSSRRSSTVNNAATKSKQAPATPPTASKRRSSQVVTQTPLAAQRAMPKKQSPLRPLGDLANTNGTTITQPRLMGPVNPPTPPTARITAAQPILPRASTEKDTRRRTFTTPSKRMGGGILSRGQVRANNEVRLPRSSTFYALYQESSPPMPTIPDQHKSLSMPVLALSAHKGKSQVSEEAVYEGQPYCNSGKTSQASSSSSDCVYYDYGLETKKFEKKSIKENKEWPLVGNPPGKFAPVKVRAAVSRSSSHPLMLLSPSFWSHQRKNSLSRPWPVTEDQVGSADCADVTLIEQVKDYMPALYWAGRFQSRFDQWRTEAMKVELAPDHQVSTEQQELCKLDQENAAACQIFLQLRDLCMSSQAVNSLWEFEYKYRQENKVLGNAFNLPPPRNRKHDDATPRPGPIGRAVRKLTPRKSSFVNLLRGKGWNTGKEDVKTTDGTTEYDLPSAKSYGSFEGIAK